MALTTNILITETNQEFNETVVLFDQNFKSARLTMSTRMFFEALEGRNVKMTRWTEGETERTTIGRGGKLNSKA